MSKVDVIIGLQHGDEAKAKCAYSICNENKNYYNFVVRFNGGPNAGHTIYHEGNKFVTHQVPVGVFFNIPSIIGPCSVIDIKKLESEVNDISNFLGKDVSDLILLDYRAHIITDKHIELDSDGSVIGSTKSGIAYAYGDKYLRSGIRVNDIETKFKKINILDLLKNNNYMLFEGAQGWGLDIDFGDYPYVTSSHCGIAGVVASGVRPKDINNVFGIAKIYETYVGNKIFQDYNDPNLDKIQEVGNEIGATTGRKRQCNYLNLDTLIETIQINQINTLIINKTDVLQELNLFTFIYKNTKVSFISLDIMLQSIEDILNYQFKDLKIIFSANPYQI